VYPPTANQVVEFAGKTDEKKWDPKHNGWVISIPQFTYGGTMGAERVKFGKGKCNIINNI